MKNFALEGKGVRVKEGFVLREVGGQTVVIATGEASENFHGMIKLNAVGKEIWKGLSEGLSEEEIAKKLSQIYTVDIETAVSDTKEFINQMKENGFLV